MSLPKISILIVTYLEQNQKYLDLCLRSILNLNYPKDMMDVLVLSSGEYEPETLGYRAIHHSTRLHYPEGVNYGISQMSIDSKHLLILNDDVILTRDSLKNMVESIGDNECLMGPISNCDNTWKYFLQLGFMDGENFHHLDKRFYRYEDLAPHADKLMSMSRERPKGTWSQDFICFYATLIPRKVWNKLGPLDPKFKTGQDDLDYCIRAKNAGIPIVVEESALIWHFGGVTADLALDNDTRKNNKKYFKEKWGIDLL